MINFIRANQLEYLLVLSCICLLISFFTIILRFDNKKVKYSLLAVEMFAFLLDFSDRYAYIFRGNETELGYWMVRITNFLVFFSQLAETLAFNIYTNFVLNLKKTPKRFWGIVVFMVMGMICLIISQFTGWYYTFDSTNHYQRAHLFVICYLFPVVAFILQSSLVCQYYKKLSKHIRFSVVLFPVALFAASVVQLFVYGISLNTMSYGLLAIILFICAIYDVNANLEQAGKKEIALLKEQAENMQELFTQTAEALAGAIDAKDEYTHGHSVRVAEYSKKMAEMAGLDKQTCQEVYYAGLLHDVGKIGIPDGIINKDCRLSDAEYAEIKKHPGKGNEILRRINKLPYLSVGALHHHERYDGNGYPDKLKATDIPIFARIIAVADAYDAMTSKRSYRDPIPQQKVREEIVKGIGTQFDPEYSRLMLHLIDLDTEYTMKERIESPELAGNNNILCDVYKEKYTEGIVINPFKVRIKMNCKPIKKNKPFYPAIVLFDSLDARIHKEQKEKRDMNFTEYGDFKANGEYSTLDIRKIEFNKKEVGAPSKATGYTFEIEAVKFKDHILLNYNNGITEVESTIVLHDNTRFAYISLTGENCNITDILIEREENLYPVETIRRIAEERIYIDGPEGDIPSIQVDSWRTSSTEGILIDQSMNISFHMKSLPFARLVWHCPFAVLYTSSNARMDSPDYRELELIRFDGEAWHYDPAVKNSLLLTSTNEFKDWDSWKQKNKAGHDINLAITKEDNVIIFQTECGGLIIKDTLTLTGDFPEIYLALTGDQCVIENIRINRI